MNAAGDTITLKRGGVWRIISVLRFAVTTDGFKIIHVEDSGATNIYQSTTIFTQNYAAEPMIVCERRFPANQTISIRAFANATTTGIDTSSAGNASRTNLSVTWSGP
jgi:hypothetical protein